MNSNMLRGRRVVGSEGNILGELSDLHVDFSKWQATGFHIVLSDEAAAELKAKKPFFGKTIVCLPTQLIEAVGDVITLKAPIRNLKDIAEQEMQVKSPRVEGKKVVSASGESVGTVEGVDVEVDGWNVAGLQVALIDHAAAELGFKQPVMSKVVVVVPESAIESIENFVTLAKSVRDLKSLVECIRSCQLQK